MPYVRKTKSPIHRKRKSNFRRYRNRGFVNKRINKRISAISRRIAGESQKFEITPQDFFTTTLGSSGQTATNSTNYTLSTITSGTPYIMPLNWYYTGINDTTQNFVSGAVNLSLNRYITSTTSGYSTISNGTYQFKRPAFYKLSTGPIEPFSGTELQYRMKYLYVNMIFNSSTPARIRFVIVKDKIPSDQGATWVVCYNR